MPSETSISPNKRVVNIIRKGAKTVEIISPNDANIGQFMHGVKNNLLNYIKDKNRDK